MKSEPKIVVAASVSTERSVFESAVVDLAERVRGVRVVGLFDGAMLANVVLAQVTPELIEADLGFGMHVGAVTVTVEDGEADMTPVAAWLHEAGVPLVEYPGCGRCGREYPSHFGDDCFCCTRKVCGDCFSIDKAAICDDCLMMLRPPTWDGTAARRIRLALDVDDGSPIDLDDLRKWVTGWAAQRHLDVVICDDNAPLLPDAVLGVGDYGAKLYRRNGGEVLLGGHPVHLIEAHAGLMVAERIFRNGYIPF